MPNFPGAQEPSFGDPHVDSNRKGAPAKRYEAQGDINTRQPTAFMAPKDPSAGRYEDMAKMGEQAQAIAVKFAVASDQSKSSAAELEFKTGMDSIKLAAANDPDPDNQGEYLNQIEKLKQKVSNKRFVFGAAKDEMNARLGYFANAENVGIINTFRTKLADKGVADMVGLLDRYAAEGGEGMEQSIHDELEKNVQANFITRQEAQKQEKAYIAEGRYNNFLKDAEADLEVSKAGLDDNVYGLSSKKLAEAKKAQHALEARAEEARKDAELGNILDLSEKLVSNSLQPGDAHDAVVSGAVNAEMGGLLDLANASPKDWTKAIKTKQISSPEQLRGRVDAFLDPLTDPDTSHEGKMAVVKSALENYTNKKLNQSEMAFILRASIGKKTDPENPIWGFLSTAGEMIGFTAKNDIRPASVGKKASLEFTAGAIKKFISTWDFREDPRPVAQQAIFQQYDEKNPAYAGWEQDGTYWTPGGQVKVTGRDPNTGSWLVEGVNAAND